MAGGNERKDEQNKDRRKYENLRNRTDKMRKE